jgi:DNA-binding SARP family transcriptional activator/tetratricopeptide (TPR) repeat protein
MAPRTTLHHLPDRLDALNPDPSPLAVHLRLSARSEVHRAGVQRPLAPLDAALLAWLALEGATPRNRLAALLWPDKAPEAARNSLRQRLFQLRRQLDFELVEGGATVSLAAGVSHDLDDADSLLQGVEIELGGEFPQWLALQRGRRQMRLRRSLADLAEMAEAASDWGDAVAHARELLALEPLSEDAHRRLMRLHYLAGDRAAALLAFDRCEQVLKHEVGTRPSAETLALLRTITATVPASSVAAPLAGNAPAAVPASVMRPPRLVGRARELAAVHAAWQAGHVAALEGEAGLGKTRLLQGFAAERPDTVMATGRPGDAGVPFATLVRLLRAVVAAAAGPATDPLPLVPAMRGEIARLLPEFDTAAAGSALAPDGQRLALQRAVQALLATRPPASTLVLDDLHFADAASLEMLASLIDGDGDGSAAEATAPPLRWVLAWRPAEAGTPLQALHDRLVEAARLVAIPLAPLDLVALAELVDDLDLPGVDGRTLAPGLLRRTGGNPLFVLETLKQAWVERSLARLARPADGALLPRPLSVGRLIERRLAQLSPGALALARVASIAGVDFSIELAESVLQAGAMQFADALNELEAAQVLRGTAFAHDLVFDAVRASVPQAIARLTHGRVAAWLEPRGGEPACVAQHWIEAGEPVHALPALARAAERAGAALRRKEQINFLERKSGIEEAAGDRAAAFDSLMRAAELQVILDGEGGHGLAQCDRLDALAADARQHILAQLQRSHLLTMRGELAQAESLAAAALREALRHGVEPALAIDCRHHLATALSLQERGAEAVVQMEASISWVDEHGDVERRAEFHANLALTLDNLGRLADAVPHHEIAIDLALHHMQHHGNAMQCLSNFAANRILGGNLAGGEPLLARMRQLGAQAEDRSSVDGFGAMLQAVCHYQRGHLGDALAALALSGERLAEFAPGYRPVVLTHEAVCWSYLGQWSRLLRLLDELGDPQALSPNTALRVTVLRHHADLALARRVDLDRLRAVVLRLGEDAPDMRHVVQLELAMHLPPDQGLAECEAVIAAARRWGHEGTLIAAQARAARLAATLGDTRATRRHAQAALALAQQRQPVRQHPAEHWLYAAQAYTAIGDTAAAGAAAQAGAAWVRARADDGVPAEFRDSFLHRQPIHRELLALASRAL